MARLNLTEEDIFKIDCTSNFTSASLGDLGYECVEEPVSDMGVNILLDCVKVKIFNYYGVMYSCYYNRLSSDIHYRQITDCSDDFITIISMLEVDDAFKLTLKKNEIQFIQIKSKILIVLHSEELLKVKDLIKPISVFIPKVDSPVLFSRILYEDVYLLRFRNKCKMSMMVVPEHWSTQRKDVFYTSVRYLQEMNEKIMGWG